MYQNADLVRLACAGLATEEADYLNLVLEAARLESQALDLDVDARQYNNPAYLVQAEALRSQSRAILDDLPVLKAGIDARRQILGVGAGQ
jgi:hypothetical protein